MIVNRIWREIRLRSLPVYAGNVTDLISHFSEQLQMLIPNHLMSLSIIGSYALNDFDPASSDIDFVVILDKQLSENDRLKLRRLHHEIERKVLRPNLNGIYILKDDLGKDSGDIGQLSFHHEGQFTTQINQQQYYEINPITWAELKDYSVLIFGSDPRVSLPGVNWRVVDRYLFENINSYWSKWLDQSGNPWHRYFYQTLLRRSDLFWCVSGVGRQYYTLREQSITSKQQACVYLLDNTSSRYHRIIHDAISFRNKRETRFPFLQKNEMRKLMAFLIEDFNRVYHEKYS